MARAVNMSARVDRPDMLFCSSGQAFGPSFFPP